MEKFSKVLSRQQAMMNHMQWRRELAEYLTLRFGYQRAITLTSKHKIGFDVQAEPHLAEPIVRRFQKNAGMPVFYHISIN